MALALCCAAAVLPQQAHTEEEVATADAPNWLVQQVRRFRSHPHLDRGYRLEQAGRLYEARAELGKAVVADPRNAEVRLHYVALLERLGEPEQVLRHTQPLLKDQDYRAAALLARARAFRALDRLEEASVALKEVAAAQDMPAEQRIDALDALVDLELKRGRYGQAHDALALLPHRDDFRLRLRRGIVHDALGRYDDAAHEFAAALHLAEDSEQRVQALAYLGQNAFKREDWAAAQAHYDAALALDPRNVELMRALTQAAHRAGDAEQALRWAEEVMTVAPTPADREVVANLRYATGDHAGAVHDYEKLLAETDDADKRVHLYAAIGYAHYDMGRYAEAAQAFDAAVRLRGTASLRKALAAAQAAARPPEGEMESLQAALRKHPTAKVHLRLGALYVERGDAQAAVRHFEAATQGNAAPRHRATAYRRLWPIRYAQGDLDAARGALEALIKLAPKDAAALRALAQIEFEQGDTASAVAHLWRSVQLKPSVSAYRSLAFATASMGDWEGAVRANRGWLAMRKLSASDRAEAYMRLATAYAEAGDTASEIETLQQALAEGFDNRPVRERLGMALFKAQRWREALPHFRALYQRKANALTALSLSRCYSAMEKTGLAVHYGREALSKAEELPPDERAQLQAELAYLYADESEFSAAATMWRQVIARDPRPIHVYHYAVAQHRAGALGEARAAWESIADGALPPEQEVERLNQLAKFHSTEGDPGGAVALYAKADALMPTAYHQYSIGLAMQQLGRPDDAIRAFEQALAREPQPGYALALGYAYVNAGRHAEAAPLLAEASEHDPDNLSLYQDVAYAYLRSFNNDKAVEWFKRGIDARLAHRERAIPPAEQQQQASPTREQDVDASLVPRHEPLTDRIVTLTGSQGFRKVSTAARSSWRDAYGDGLLTAQSEPAIGLPQHADPELERMRDEVRRLEKNWNVTLYQAYSPAHDRADAGVPSTGGSVVPSQGGLEISYRPPVVGFRDERIFDIYARLLWSNTPRSLEIEEDSLQGGIGLRYKPFRTLQLYVSGERLFKVGDDAQDTWLARLSYGWTDMHDSKLGQTNWNYSSIYADFGVFADDDHTRAFYGEVRQGRTFKLSDQWLLSPHVVINGRHEQPNFSPGSYWQAGVGVSVKYLYNATRYASYRSNIEVLLHYKVGMAHVASGWLFTFVARL